MSLYSKKWPRTFDLQSGTYAISILWKRKAPQERAGKLEDHEVLQPRLDKALKRHNEDTARFRALEQRVTTLLEKYATQVDTFSELFVEWSETIAEIEERVSKLEKADKMNMGLTY